MGRYCLLYFSDKFIRFVVSMCFPNKLIELFELSEEDIESYDMAWILFARFQSPSILARLKNKRPT